MAESDIEAAHMIPGSLQSNERQHKRPIIMTVRINIKDSRDEKTSTSLRYVALEDNNQPNTVEKRRKHTHKRLNGALIAAVHPGR